MFEILAGDVFDRGGEKLTVFKIRVESMGELTNVLVHFVEGSEVRIRPVEAFTEMPPDIQQDQAEDRRYLAELRLKDGLPEVVAEVSGLDMGRADAELLARVARLRSWELLVHVTGEVAVRGVSPESLWGQQLGRVVARWPLPPRKKSGEVSREGGRTWRRLWRDSEARRRLVERWAADGVMRGWEHSHERFEIRGQTLEGREFLYAGDDIRPMVDVFVPDRTRWVDYWPYYEVPVEEPAPGEDLVLAIDFDRVSWSFVPHLVLVGRDAQVRLPVRPAYSEEGATDQRLRGFERFPTAVRVARHVLPEGLRAVRVINVAVESMSNVSNNFVVYELFRLEAGPLPPEAAFAAPPTEEVP